MPSAGSQSPAADEQSTSSSRLVDARRWRKLVRRGAVDVQERVSGERVKGERTTDLEVGSEGVHLALHVLDLGLMSLKLLQVRLNVDLDINTLLDGPFEHSLRKAEVSDLLGDV